MNNMIAIVIILLLMGLTMFTCETTSGIKMVQLPVTNDPTITFRFWFKVGSQNDPVGKEGLAALTARMLTEGATDSNSYEDILKKLYPMAASYNAQVDKEMTVIIGRAHKDNLEAYYKLFKEAILAPAFKQEDFNRLKSQTLNYLERLLRYANDEEFGKQTLNWFIFRGTPYGHPEQGLIESVKSITLEDVKNFYKTYYTRDNLVIGLGGGYPKDLVTRINRDLATLPSGKTVPPEKPAAEPIEGLQFALVEKDCESTAISFGYPIDVLRGSRDYYALWLANSWLGEHRNSSSHLYQVIREARGMNYGDYSYIENFPEGHLRQFPPSNVARRQQIFQVWIRPVQNQARLFALRAAIRELQKLVDNGLSQEQFELTKKFLSKYYLHYAPTTSERLGYKIDDVFYGIKGSHLENFPRILASLTLEEVNAAIKKHLQYKNMKVAMITKDAESLKKDLLAKAVSPMNYTTPKPPEVLEEDKEIEKYPLEVKAENIHIYKVDEMFVK